MIGTDTKLKVGLASFAQPTFDVPWAESIRARTVTLLESLGVEVVAWDRPLMYEKEAYEFRKKLREADVDAVILQPAGFSFGGLPVIIAAGVNVPCIVWSTPEPAWDGGKMRSNSLCAGIMHNAHLKQAGKNVQFIYCAPDGEAAAELAPMLKALSAMKNLKNSKLGIVGHRAPGFYCTGFDELKLQSSFGVQVFHIDISTVFAAMESISDADADGVLVDLGARLDEEAESNRDAVRRSVRVYLALKQLASEHSLDALAVKCWPDFPTHQGIMVCLALALLNNDGVVAACEADVYGMLTMLIQNLLGKGPQFFNDLIQIDAASNLALYWHCGSAAPSLAANREEMVIRPHAQRGVPAAINFPLLPGRVSVSRLSEDGDGWRMFHATGEAIETPQLLRGNPSHVKMDLPVQRMLDSIIAEGFEHHYSTSYGDITAELEWFCRFLSIRLVQPE